MDEAIMESVRGCILPVAITAAHNNSLSGHLSDGD
jgi:hypothetical protein